MGEGCFIVTERRRCGTPAAGQVASWPAGNPVNTVQWPVYFRKRVLLRKEQMTGEWTGCQKGKMFFTILWSPLLLFLIVSVCCFLLKCWPHARRTEWGPNVLKTKSTTMDVINDADVSGKWWSRRYRSLQMSSGLSLSDVFSLKPTNSFYPRYYIKSM